MRGHSPHRSRSRKKTPKVFNVEGHADNVVLIDVDSDGFENVIIVDAPESLNQKLKGPTVATERGKCPLHDVISIDDDEISNIDHLENATKGCDVDSDASSSKSRPASNFRWKHVDLDDDECQVIQENKIDSKLSKSKQKCFSEAPWRNHFGLSSESENSTSESDCSDCEVMDGSRGKLREQWEKAFLRRRHNVKSGVEDQSSASGSYSDTTQSIGGKNRTEQDTEAPVFSGFSNEDVEKGSPTSFTPTDNVDLGGTSFRAEKENPFVGSYQKLDSDYFSWLPSDRTSRSQTSEKGVSRKAVGVDSIGKRPSLWFNKEQSKKPYCSRSNHVDEGQNITGEHLESHPISKKQFDYRADSVQDEDTSTCKNKPSDEAQVAHERVVPSNKYGEFSSAPETESQWNYVSKKEEKQVNGESLASGPLHEKGKDSSFNNSGAVIDESFPVKSPSCRKINDKKAGIDKKASHSKQSEANSVDGKSCVAEGDKLSSNSDCQIYGRKSLCAEGSNSMPCIEKDIINDREKLKETDEYKRVIEEEWASRQRELQVQAEEAQRLRKRKKAESMRLLDMTRRQKQRVEEMRESQKKDEENINLKEQLRVVVRKELNILEVTCFTLASLLRGLGINVGGGVHPSSQEVHLAYKQALLRFHPDRASRSDAQQQVEAEEKFKLISRMKEKLSPW